MRYDKKAIMTSAWKIRKSNPGYTMSDALRTAWALAKDDQQQGGEPMEMDYIKAMSADAQKLYNDTRFTFQLVQIGADTKLMCRAYKAIDDKDLKSKLHLLPEIKAAMIAERAAAQKAAAERQAKRNSIPGIKEIEDADRAVSKYRSAFARAMDSGDGVFPSAPTSDPDALRREYPAAAAMLEAESWSRASHDVKASAGARAVDRMLDGMPFNEAMDKMHAEWQAHCDAHMWD